MFVNKLLTSHMLISRKVKICKVKSSGHFNMKTKILADKLIFIVAFLQNGRALKVH